MPTLIYLLSNVINVFRRYCVMHTVGQISRLPSRAGYEVTTFIRNWSQGIDFCYFVRGAAGREEKELLRSISLLRAKKKLSEVPENSAVFPELRVFWFVQSPHKLDLWLCIWGLFTFPLFVIIVLCKYIRIHTWGSS